MTDTENPQMADVLIRLRDDQDLTQEGLAAIAHVSRSTIQAMERGQPPKRSGSLRKVADALGVSVAELRGQTRADQDRELIETARNAMRDELGREPTEREVTGWLLRAAMEKIRHERGVG